MKNLVTFEEFVNESTNSNLNENLRSDAINSKINSIARDLNLHVVKTEKIKFTAKGAQERIMTEVESGNYAFVITFNETQSPAPNPGGRIFDTFDSPNQAEGGPYWSLSGIVEDKVGKFSKLAGIKPGEAAYIVGHSAMKWYDSQDNWDIGQLGLIASFASGNSKALTPIKDHFAYNAELNKVKGSESYLVILK
jgi:hypothetical protein